jgi:hypothetical protein
MNDVLFRLCWELSPGCPSKGLALFKRDAELWLQDMADLYPDVRCWLEEVKNSDVRFGSNLP